MKFMPEKSDGTSEKELLCPMPGMVISLAVEVGQEVKAGESLAVIEAMKMETSVSAPAAGSIVEVRVQGGDSCAVGDVLVTLA